MILHLQVIKIWWTTIWYIIFHLINWRINYAKY